MELDTITRWVAAIVGGAVIGLQGLELKQGNDTEHELEQAIAEVHQIHSVIDSSVKRQIELHDMMQRMIPAPTPP